MPETVRPPARWSDELALEHPAEQPALMERRLVEIEVPAKLDVRFGPQGGGRGSKPPALNQMFGKGARDRRFSPHSRPPKAGRFTSIKIGWSALLSRC